MDSSTERIETIGNSSEGNVWWYAGTGSASYRYDILDFSVYTSEPKALPEKPSVKEFGQSKGLTQHEKRIKNSAGASREDIIAAHKAAIARKFEAQAAKKARIKEIRNMQLEF